MQKENLQARKPRIGIDVSLIHRKIGMGVLLASLLPSLLSDETFEYVLFASNRKAFASVAKYANAIKIYVPLDPRGFDFQNPVFEQICLPFLLKKYRVDKMFYPYNTMPLLLSPRVKHIALVHDVIYVKKIEGIMYAMGFVQRLGRQYRKFFVSRSIQKADKIITISKYVKGEILSFFPTLSASKISVVYNPLPDIYLSRISEKKILSIYTIEEKKYMLALLAKDPRKNSMMILQAFHTMIKSVPDMKLVFTGVKEYTETPEYQYIIDKPELQSNVVFTGFVDITDLVDLYTYAKVFLYPSLAEGFGLPVLEALSREIAVITSKDSPMEEVAHDYAVYIDPHNKDMLTEEMIKAVGVSLSSDRHKAREYATSFTVAHAAQQYLAVFHSV